MNTQIASPGRGVQWSGPCVSDTAACDDRGPLGSRFNYNVAQNGKDMRGYMQFTSPVAATGWKQAGDPHPASVLFSPKQTYDNIVAAGKLGRT